MLGVRRDARVRVCGRKHRLRDRRLEREVALHGEARADRAGMDIRQVDHLVCGARMLRVRVEHAGGEADCVRQPRVVLRLRYGLAPEERASGRLVGETVQKRDTANELPLRSRRAGPRKMNGAEADGRRIVGGGGP